MTLENLLSIHRLQAFDATAGGVQRLLAAAVRNLADAGLPGRQTRFVGQSWLALISDRLLHNIYTCYTELSAMNFNIYLDDETGQQLNRAAEQAGESRNALIRRAVSEWLNRHGKPQWPDEVLAFKGMADMPLFEAGRNGLTPPAADPLA